MPMRLTPSESHAGDSDGGDSDAEEPGAEGPDVEQLAGSCCCLPDDNGLQMPRSDSIEANKWFH
jgi:hypothetical protein